MSKKLPKNIMIANLLAQAAADAAGDEDHRAQFDHLIDGIKSALATAHGPEVVHDRGLDSDFIAARHIAQDKLRMSPAEFENVVSVLNTPFSRVIKISPSGKGPRDLPDFLKMPDDEMRIAFDLRTPYDAAFFVARHGKSWGYSEAQVLKAESELRPLDRARRAKIAEADEVRAAAESARIAARASAGYTATLYSADGTSQPYL
ncbi:hypothetical protein CN065_14245 [Sinorhizobium meliloti]|uniref:hypothetical protein n=1 Tax=Rhizobium meliloti TaxID=382 RepID=UPI000B4A1EDE|nr:hypothetical protein [Sinorhizobium meliloti]ASP98411.1 hypothetical protein CDO24_13810 [Sinorhizobium meliloti]MQV66156.1 hypothetical protein [Sinorhizobium meliloti]RVQ39353.1 hypothetical protein CN065_14245 [Sinorhizobium meliloti]